MDIQRTIAPYVALLLMFLAVSVVGLLLFLYYELHPSTETLANLIQLSVGLGTGLLAVAAIVTLYFQALENRNKRAPHLGLTFVSSKENSNFEFLEGDNLPLSTGEFVLKIQNVGPGVARDVWFYRLPPVARRRGNESSQSAEPPVRAVTMKRYLPSGDSIRISGMDLFLNLSDPPETEGISRRIIVVGCEDITGALGDVELIGLRRPSSDSNWSVLSPEVAENVNWELSAGSSRWWWRRMGFWPRKQRRLNKSAR